MSRRIVLSFEHPECGSDVEIYVPLPDPIQEGAEAIAARCLPSCPLCKLPTRYIGFRFDSKEDGRMPKITHVHWLFKEEPTLVEHQLCDFPHGAHDAPHSIVLRPVIRQKPGGRLRECPSCAKIGKELGIP